MKHNRDSEQDYHSKIGEEYEEKKRKKRMIWNSSQDKYLKELLLVKKIKGWQQISNDMNKVFPDAVFTAKKCRSRWNNSQDPSLNKTGLRESELLLVLAHHRTYRNSWSQIAKQYPGRNTNLLRNSFYGLFRKVLHNIQHLKKRLAKFSPSFFIQALYMTTYLMKINSPASRKEKDTDIAPEYIFDLVKASRIPEERSREYLSSLQKKFKSVHNSQEAIRGICELDCETLTTTFLDRIMDLISKEVKITEELSDEKVLGLEKKAFDNIKKSDSNRSSKVAFPRLSLQQNATPNNFLWLQPPFSSNLSSHNFHIPIEPPVAERFPYALPPPIFPQSSFYDYQGRSNMNYFPFFSPIQRMKNCYQMAKPLQPTP